MHTSNPTRVQIKTWQKIAALDGNLFGATKPVGQFIERYMVCETIARKLITDKTGKACPETLQLQQIYSAIRWFQLAKKIDLQFIEQLFRGGKGHRNSKTPRQLRNAIVHGIARNDCNEVNRRNTELMQLMEHWINTF